MRQYPDFSVLIVDDERHVRKSFQMTLMAAGITNTVEVDDPATTLDLMAKQEVGLAMLDLMMPKVSGDQLLREIVKLHPETPVIIITGVNEVGAAVDCIKAGAFDYLVKPVDKDRLVTSVKKAIEFYELRRENAIMKERFLHDAEGAHPAFAAIVTQNEGMLSLFKYAEAIAKSAQPTLLTGETGVGKELFAKALHDLSGRQGKFVPVNVAGLDSNMFSDTLFGHLRGAFTGAIAPRKGLIENAEGGTLFLDEIGDLTLESQVKLLRLLQEREYVPIGSDDPKRTNAKIILATHRDLNKKMRDGTFREDLYYRLRTHHIKIPPLRERPEDIPTLLDHFIVEAAAELGKKPPSYPPQLLTLLKNHDYPGNVREMRAIVHDAVSRHQSKILSMDLFKDHIAQSSDSAPVATPTAAEAAGKDIVFPEKLPTLKDATEALVFEALRRADKNQSIAAKLLGVTQQALSHRLKKFREKEECADEE